MVKKFLNIFFYMFSFLLTYYLLATGANHNILSYMLILVIVSTDIAMYIVDEYEKSFIMEKQKLALYQKELDNQKENIEAIKQRNIETARRNHDLKKNISIVMDLLEHEQYEEAKEYVCKLEEKCNSYFSYQMYSNNSVISMLLNSKIEFCKSNGIDVKCFVCGRIDGIDDVELYCLIVNLLDNAISAALSSKEPYISIFINCSEKEVFGEFINSIKDTECADFEEMIPKSAEDGHGYGLLNIHEIIKKNNGKIDFLVMSKNMLKVTFKIKKMPDDK